MKKEATGGAKPVQTRLCGSDGREGTGVTMYIRTFFCWSVAYMC